MDHKEATEEATKGVLNRLVEVGKKRKMPKFYRIKLDNGHYIANSKMQENGFKTTEHSINAKMFLSDNQAHCHAKSLNRTHYTLEEF